MPPGAITRVRPAVPPQGTYVPAGIPDGGRRHSGCPSRPRGRGWQAGTAGRPWCPLGPGPPSWTACQTPSWCCRASDWTSLPTGCVASLARPPAPVYLRTEERRRESEERQKSNEGTEKGQRGRGKRRKTTGYDMGGSGRERRERGRERKEREGERGSEQIVKNQYHVIPCKP